MARLEFAILQYLDHRGVRVVLQRDEEQILERLQARVKENLGIETDRYIGEEVEKAIDKAFKGLIKEFKDETLRIV